MCRGARWAWPVPRGVCAKHASLCHPHVEPAGTPLCAACDVGAQVDWGNALRLCPARSGRNHEPLALAADGYFGANVKKAVDPVMDLESIAYTWLAIVHGSGEAPWDRSDTVRSVWLDKNAGDAGVARVLTFLQKPGYSW